MPLPKITAKELKAQLPALAAGVHRVRLVLSYNADITLKRVTVEGQTVTKWTPLSGLWYWDKPDQVIAGQLDVTLEAMGGPNGAISLVTVCDSTKCGTINLTTKNGPAGQEAHYEI
jgi:hypothetical protein